MNKVEIIVEKCRKALKEADKDYEEAADGYDKGWYAGASYAYSEILAILEKNEGEK